jgi:hypothetical protein
MIFVFVLLDKYDICICFIFVRVFSKRIIYEFWGIRSYLQISIDKIVNYGFFNSKWKIVRWWNFLPQKMKKELEKFSLFNMKRKHKNMRRLFFYKIKISINLFHPRISIKLSISCMWRILSAYIWEYRFFCHH